MDSAFDSIKMTSDVHWFPLRAFRLRFSGGNSFDSHVEKFNAISHIRMESFAPTIIQVSSRLGELKRCTRPLACNYVFIRAEENQLREFVKAFPIYSPLYSRFDGIRSIITIPDGEMNNFIRLANAYQNNLPCFSPTEIDLQKGDKVKIIGGPFAGIVGILQSQKGKNGGRVSVNVANLLAAETLDIAPDYIQILQFAPHSKRIYDALDAFIPRLQKARDNVALRGSLTQENRASLIYFINRYGATNIPEPKTRAKHHILLLAALSLIVDRHSEQASCDMQSSFVEMQDSITAQLPDLIKTVTNKNTLSKIISLLPDSLLNKLNC